MNLIWKYLKKFKKTLVFALVLAAINQIFSLLDPYIFRLMIDNYASKISQIPANVFIQGIIILLLASVGVAMVSRIAKNFQDYFVNVITQKISASLYAQGISHSFLLPYAAFEDQRSGELLKKLDKARTDAQLLITNLINTLFFALVGVIFVLVYATIVNRLIGLIYFLMIPVLGFGLYFLSRKIKAAQKNIVKQQADLAGSTTETLRNVELVKSLGLESQETNRLNQVNENILNLELKKVKLIRLISFGQGTLINSTRSILIFLMFWLILKSSISLGEFLSLYIYSFFIFTPLSDLGNISNQYQEAKASSEQLQAVLQIPPEKKPANPQVVGQLKNIRFEGVDFSYGYGQKTALKNINLDIKAGQTIAFVGPSGSGKTTLVKLLVGLYQPTKGNLFFNEVAGHTIDFTELRKRIGLVSQETQLFAGTIRENLLFVNPAASDQDCLRVMELAAAKSILERGGQGLNTKIGEGGLKLSGGERQRLAIARALLRNPDLIIFDEATSSLDSLTEQSITQTIKSIEKMRPNLITVLVAHRLSTIAHAKKIYVLEKGRIIEQGNHDQLVKQGGLYAALWRQQIASTSDSSPHS